MTQTRCPNCRRYFNPEYGDTTCFTCKGDTEMLTAVLSLMQEKPRFIAGTQTKETLLKICSEILK